MDLNVPAWMANGRCAGIGPAVMYPEDQAGSKVAQAICRGCPVRLECLKYALTNGEEHGVWGGYAERERRERRSRLLEMLSTCDSSRADLPSQEERSVCEQPIPMSA